MKRLSLLLLLGIACAPAFGQAAYSGILTAQSTTSVGNPLTTVVVPAPGASIVVYGFGTLVKSSVCPDSTLVGCTAIAPNNPITADARGNFSFYIAAGAYDYTITPVGGATQGPYHIFLPMGITPPSTVSLSGVTVAASQGGTGANNTATLNRYLKGSGATFATSNGSAAGTGTLTCTNQFLRTFTSNSDAAPTGNCNTVTTTDTDTTIAKTGVDINTSSQVTAVHLAAALPVASGGTGQTSSTGSGAVVLATSPSLTTPTMSAPTMSGTSSLASATFSGSVSSYNGASTAGQGLLPIQSVTSQKAESAADTAVLTFTPPAVAGSYRIRFTEAVSAQNTATLGWTATWKDANGSAQAPTNLSLFKSGTAAPALTFVAGTNDNYYGYLDIDVDNSGTNIVVKTTFTGTSFTSKVTATIERIN